MLLILGGTAEARAAAGELTAGGVPVISSLAGRVANPRLPAGGVRIGGFGGPDKLAEYLAEQGVRAVLDATHPFAERISASAKQACETTGTPLLRLERPGWSERAGDSWLWVEDLQHAATTIIERAAGRVFLTTGRQGLATFARNREAWFLIRCVDPPDPPLPARHELLLDRGPYTTENELELIDGHRIDLLVTKDSGGEQTVAKLDAARARKVPVVIVRRPARPHTPTVTTVHEAVAWAQGQDG
jgi:precorrin-6A/cobalt-precorrin-6A reductase